MVEKWTKERVEKELADTYLTFKSYYKYSFTFEGEPDRYFLLEDNQHYRLRVTATYGGSHDDIYRFNVSIHSPVKLLPLNRWNWVLVDVGRYDKWETVYEEESVW